MIEPIPLLGPEVYDGIEARGLDTDIFAGWHSNEPFFETIIELSNPQTIIEVGTWKGASAIHMGRLAPQAHIFCVDHWLGGCDHVTAQCAFRQGVQRDRHGWPQIYYQFLHNVKSVGMERRITPVPMMTTDGARLLALHGIKADLIYIDADHNEGPCAADIRAYLPLMKSGGFMFGDDYGLTSVHDAVRSVLGDGQFAEPSGNFWFAKIV